MIVVATTLIGIRPPLSVDFGAEVAQGKKVVPIVLGSPTVHGIIFLKDHIKSVLNSVVYFHLNDSYDFNAANFRRHSQRKCALQTNELECDGSR